MKASFRDNLPGSSDLEAPRVRIRPHRASHNVQAFAGLDAQEDSGLAEWLMFDAACPFCTRLVIRARPILGRRNIRVLPLLTKWVQRFVTERDQPLLKEIRFLDARGELSGGADALLEVAARIWWTRPLAWLGCLPFVRTIARHAYQFVAEKRHCFTSRAGGPLKPRLAG